MPCYDPPPAWEGSKRSNAEQAAKLLCGAIGMRLDAGQPVGKELLTWYLEHRHIDMQIASAHDRQSEAAAARADVARVTKLLKA